MLLSSENYNLITRDYGLRNKLRDANFAYEMDDMLKRRKITLEYLFQQAVDKAQRFENLIAQYIITMTQKYSRECALNNICVFYETGNSKLITRENNLRERITLDYLHEMLGLMHMTINDYYTYIEIKYNLTGEKSKGR